VAMTGLQYNPAERTLPPRRRHGRELPARLPQAA
jgi:hypothetical protein